MARPWLLLFARSSSKQKCDDEPLRTVASRRPTAGSDVLDVPASCRQGAQPDHETPAFRAQEGPQLACRAEAVSVKAGQRTCVRAKGRVIVAAYEGILG